MAEHHQPQHPRRQQPLAAVTQKLRDFLSERGPSTAEVLAFVTVVPVGGFLILLAGLTLAGTLIGLAVTAPLFVLFSPVLVPAALTIGFAVAGFLTSVALGVTALCSFTWTANYLRRMRERNTISGGQHEDPGASSSSTSPERSDSGGPHEDAGVSRSSTSPERSDSGPPASSTSPIGDDYCVFLSFRGSDTRNGFADHLYRRLKGVGLRFDPNFVFRDDEKLLFGKDIGANLISAITNSKVSIPVISPNYASSEWCLRELIHIMECKESRGQIVLPVLYNVEPKDVRCLLGSFGKAFQSLEHCLDEEFKQKGRQALIKAADLRVFESRKFANGHEAELVDKLVALVMRQQQEVFQPCLHKNLVGIDDHVPEVMKLVDIAYPNTRIIGLYGMGGIGKTTLATVIYNKLFEKFECHSFLMDIRETINCRSIEHVQSQLISDILKFPDYQVHDSYTGIRIIQSNFKEKKVLILLDDVDKKDVLKKLIGDCNFMSGSRIIVTCRDKAILESKYEYELKEMNIKDSRCLFGIYAFEGKPPPPELANLSREIVATTGGLPLALMVIGSLLKGEEDQRVWREMWKKLGKAPNMTVQQKLRISYDMLEPKEQQIFLDIACFFIGTDKRIAIYLWDDLELYPLSALAKMTQRMLIKCDDNNEFGMHDQLRDLGKAIARPADKKPWDYSRLWDEAAMTTLVHKEENENIEALLLDMNGSSKFMEQESFKRMPNLKVLHSSAVGFAGDFEESLSELRWLKWEGCPDSFEAANVHFKKLLILDLFRGNISENWGGWSSIKMERLKVLNLTWCLNLKSTPNLAAFKSLEMLILENCRYLERIDPSIGDVKCLVSLNLRYCGSLKKLPAQLGQLKELEELLIDETGIQEIPECITFLNKLKTPSVEGCHRLTKVPSALGHLVKLPIQKLSFPYSMGIMAQRLMTLDLSYTCIEELPECIEKLKNLKYLTISRSKIRKLPSAIGKLRGLQMLDASGCQKLEGQIPVDFGGLFSLRTLCLCRTKISSLPKNFHELYTLEHLNLLHCGELQSLPIPPSGLLTLRLTCRSNMLPSFSHLSLLKELTLHSCVSLISIPVLPSCIQKLCIRKCPELKSLPNFSNLKSLLELVLSQCYGLMEFHGLKALESLRKLDISRNTELSNLDNFEDLELLTNLEMQADNLHEIGGLCELRSLEVLNISGCKHVQRLDLSKSEHLKQLVVNDCESLVEICCHDRTELEHFEWKGCKSLKKLPNGLANCKS